MNTVILDKKFNDFINQQNFGHLTFAEKQKIAKLVYLMYAEAFSQFDKNKADIKDGYVVDFDIDYSVIKDAEFFHEDTKRLRISLKFKDKVEKPINFKDHFFASMEIKDGLCALYSNQFSYYPKETTIDKWQWDFLSIAYNWLNYIFESFKFYQKYGITDNGYVVDKDLAKRIIGLSASLYYKDKIGKHKAFMNILKTDGLEIDEYLCWWFAGDKGNPIIGMNGIFIQTVEGYLKENSCELPLNREDIDYTQLSDEEIQDFMEMGNYISLPVKDRMMTFILSEGD